MSGFQGLDCPACNVVCFGPQALFNHAMAQHAAAPRPTRYPAYRAEPTVTQLKYLRSVARGLTAEEVAHEHGVSYHTVISVLKVGRRVAGALNQTHAVALAFAAGHLTADDLGGE